MSGFDTVVVVDWSGGNDRGPHPKKDAIWAAVVRGDRAEAPHYLRNRAAADDWLCNLFTHELAAGRRVLAGFDFPFGYPDGFAARVVGSPDPLALWNWYRDNLDDWPRGNNRFALAARLNARFPGIGPFWFNALAKDIPGLPRKGRARHGHGMCERRLCERHAGGAFSCWQLGGAGAVGSQAITGMAALARLRARFGGAIAVWPFQPLAAPIALVEVWPSLYAEAVRAASAPGTIRDAVQVCVLARHIAALGASGRLGATLAAVPDVARHEEGWIFGLPRPAAEVGL